MNSVERLFAISFYYYRNGAPKMAKTILKIYFLINPGDYVARAFDATLDVMCRNYSGAKIKFTKVISKIHDTSTINNQYVKCYCLMYLCMINKCRGCELIRKKAMGLEASKKLKNILMIPDYTIYDEDVNIN